jgi:hypothetical protein
MIFLKSGGALQTTAWELANRIEKWFYELFASLGRLLGKGHSRQDLTKRPVLFPPVLVPGAVWGRCEADPYHGRAERQA